MNKASARESWEGAGGLKRMRDDWDRRAVERAEGYVYTRDAASDIEDFIASGQANYDQLVRPYLPILLEGRPPSVCRAVEIGCGIGRMTRAFAAQFGEVHGIDISPAMIERARQELATLANVRLQVGAGDSLVPLPDEGFDLVFSYIVFQHIPSKTAIENYVREAWRVLRPRGVFKFQINGDQSSSYVAHERDSWQGETFSLEEAREMLARHRFVLLAAEGIGTQYFVLTARKAESPPEPGERPYILAGESWAAQQLVEGFGEAVQQSWRPMSAPARARLVVPGAGPLRFFTGIYFWPETGWHPREIRFDVAGQNKSFPVTGPGDHYFEFGGRELEPGATVTAGIDIDPPCGQPPAFRCMGLVQG